MTIDARFAAQIRGLFDELTVDPDAFSSPQVAQIQKHGVTEEHQRYVVADLISAIPLLLRAAEGVTP